MSDDVQTRADAMIEEIAEQRNQLGARAALLAAELATIRKEKEGLEKRVSDLEAQANGSSKERARTTQ